MTKNRGITLIELIIVIAILGIIIGGVGLTFSIVNSADIEGCTQTLDISLEKTKNECMTKIEQQYLVLYKSTQDDYPGYYIGNVSKADLATYTLSPEKDTKIGGNKIQIKIKITVEGETDLDVATTPIFFTFDRATGAFMYLNKGIPSYATTYYPSSITITNGSKTNIINCIQATGKHFIE